MTDKLLQQYNTLPRLNLKGRQLYDLELLLVGGFDPLTGYMNEAEYNNVVESMRLEGGQLFPIPIVLDVPESLHIKLGSRYCFVTRLAIR